MPSLSISLTLGKASEAHGTNVDHNNRNFIAKNVDSSKTPENITYVKQDVEESYDELFAKALEEYNSKQNRNDRIIQNYYNHISKSKREEAFYEIIVQFGDKDTAPCESENGKESKKMLDEYIRNFKKRNPNLHIFNAVLHMDEASPHLHIDFIPFYTKYRKKGLSKGVSMRTALDEQGFKADNGIKNRLVAWEQSEREEMEKILNHHGYNREDKNAHYVHMNVDDYKTFQDHKMISEMLRQHFKVTDQDLEVQNILQLKNKLKATTKINQQLQERIHSPYKSFYYSSPENQSFVQSKLEELEIPYRETENGFEAQECYVNEIRKIEKQFKPVKSSAREQLRNDIDRLLMQSGSIEELLEKLKTEKYTIKLGKYIAVKPMYNSNFIRLKSLGELYSEYALKNRIKSKAMYESEIQKKITQAEKDSPKYIILRTIQFYTVSFKKNALPMYKRTKQKPFSWNNDKALDVLTTLNNKINSGSTLASLKNEFEQWDKITSNKANELEKLKKELESFYELKEKILIIYENKNSDKYSYQQAKEAMKTYPDISKDNYLSVDRLIENEINEIKNTESEYLAEKEKLKEAAEMFSTAEKVFGGTYVQSLVADERQRRESKYTPNGLKDV